METNGSKPTAKITPPPSSAAFLISADDAAAMAEERGARTLPDLLPYLVPLAMSLSRPPISRFPVGCAGVGPTGRIYLGANLEFPLLPLHHSVHAEQFLVANAAAHGEPLLTHLAVSHVPCGHCRQFLQELRGASDLQILVTSDPEPAFRPLSDLLPHPFGPRDLLPDGAPLLLDHPNHDLTVVDDDGDEGAICNGDGGRMDLDRRLRTAALEGARGAHAPYSGCPAGFAVGDGKGRVWGGGYAESAAYNPSLGPVQASLIAYVAGGGGGYEEIIGAALVESEGPAAVSHESTARILLEAVAPKCRLRVYHFKSMAEEQQQPKSK